MARSSTALASLVFTLVAACGGGGSSSDGGTISGLSVADSMSVVTTNDGGSSAVVTPQAQADTSGFSASCDYNTDVSRNHVYDPSMKPLQTVNMILCLVKQTAYADVVNEGLYKAQVDEVSCNQGGEGGSTGQSSGTQQSFNVWVIENTRSTSTSDQVCEFWIPPNGEDNKQIRVRMTISKGRDEANPFGVFDLNWIEVDLDDDSIAGFGNLHTLDANDGYVGFSFYQENGDVDVVPPPNSNSERVQANVQMTADQTQGIAHVHSIRRENHGGSTAPQESDFALAFNETSVARRADDNGTVTTLCLSRVEFDTRTWRYGLYDATNGDRIELNSGFGFQTDEGTYGWVGYHGLWLPGNETVESGETITRNTYGNTEPQTYTVLVAPGKLIRNTRQTLALTELSGVVFEWWHPSLVGGFQMIRDRVEYQDSAWFATERWDDKLQTWSPFEIPVTIDVESLGFLGMYSEALGGPVSYLYGNEYVTFFTRSTVGPDDVLFKGDDTVQLSGFFNCLGTGITATEAEAGNVYLPDSNDVETPHVYTIHQEDMSFTLNVTGDPVVGLAPNEVPQYGPNTWGMTSGPMVTDSVLFKLQFPGQVWNVDEFFTYETGANSWNTYTAVFDQLGDPVVFDKPIQFAYTHTTEDDANDDDTFDGRTFLLNYSGPGDLGGIPFHGVDFDFDDQPDRWYPEFSIRTGTLCGPNGTEYVIRALESEQTLAVGVSSCTGLDVQDALDLELPDDTVWTDPNMDAIPTVTGAPRVIDGRDVASDN